MWSGVFSLGESVSVARLAWIAASLLLFFILPAQSFDYSKYKTVDLDELMDRPRPKVGVDIFNSQYYKVTGALAAYGEPCQTGMLTNGMMVGGIPKATIDAVPITRCIKVRTAKGRVVSLYIQDAVSNVLPKEVALGGSVTFYVLRVFADPDKQGILINEYDADDGAAAKQRSQAPDQPKDKGAEKQAGSSGPAITDLRGEWRRAGAGFSCNVQSPSELPPESVTPDVLAKACLHMGPFLIGGTAQSLTSALGAAHRTLPQPKDATALIYFLERSEQLPYLVATVQKDRIVALQVSGSATTKDFGFNHINLGDDTKTLIRYFGAASRVGPSGEAGTDLWSYQPWPFSFEVKAAHVTSIRIVDPTYQE